MVYLLGILLFFLGACIGSFMGVVSEPVKKRSIWTGRSKCLSCNRTLTGLDLVPLFSYLFLGGRCRTCRAKIPSSLFYLEIGMASFFTIFGLAGVIGSHDIAATVISLLCGTFLVALSSIDIRTFTLPDRMTIPMIAIIAVLVACVAIFGWTGLPTPLMALAGAAVGLYFYLIQIIIPALVSGKKKYFSDVWKLIVTVPLWIIARIFVSEKKADAMFPSFAVIDDVPAWVGGGDLRLGVLVGLMVGPDGFLLSVMIGYTFGSFLYLFLRLFGHKLERLPVGPLLCVGVCATWLIRFYS